MAPPTQQQLDEVALTRGEYEEVVRRLQRAPNHLELGIIGALWSEHCSYKTSRSLLRTLPTTGPRVLQGPGENAGAIDIGGGLACVFKIESHNHPSAIEPYQGAATGVGGILRDIFTMGARPIALLDSLRFGSLDDPRQRHLFDGVVAGIGGYGNCIGVPTVGGEVYFDDSYRTNCLVNAMCVGVVEQQKMTRAAASGPGNLVLLVGADTGRDGIHGASFASLQLDATSDERRPAVQVGNPFLEKCLMEACLELAGDARVIALQDLGAAGLSGSAAELAHRGGCGIELDVSRVSRREAHMTPYEVMLSESQERMLLVVPPDAVRFVQETFDRWDLHSDVVGVVLADPRFMVRDGPEQVADLPIELVVDGAPQRKPEPRRPKQVDAALRADPLRREPLWSPDESLLVLLASPNIGSRAPVFRRYDHQVGDGTVIGPGADAALVRVEGTRIALACSTDGNARYGELDPFAGAVIAVCESARNVVATGARPVALTNCLNFGNPEKPDVAWQLHEAVRGLRTACERLQLPIVSGNVSLYNDTEGVSIAPTVVIGMVGVLDDIDRHCTAAFQHENDVVAVVGPLLPELGGSELQRLALGVNEGARPAIDLELEARAMRFVHEAIARGLVRSVHDVAEGGLAVALAESCILGGIGARVALDEMRSPLSAAEEAGILFGESQSRFLVSFAREALVQLHELSSRWGVPFHGLGAAGGDRIVITGAMDVALEDARSAYEGALSQ
ncbi:MAG: phosphoribosylformylglycinamidine synthase subunit PurL [Candidatus Dormibacteraeota bacterium]|nr:phosphoribosylformylglycinamidine synthase subunit PurL [Candidatus Dormibacteraeota bacterium]